jgi:hypothetical protein
VDEKTDKASVLKASVEHVLFLIQTLKNAEKRGVKLPIALPSVSELDGQYSDFK